ncbi:MAG: phospholipase D-like domain-containing protein [Bacteroidia bacterium]
MNSRNYIGGNKIKLVHGGEEYFDALLEVIERARHFLHLQVYIFDVDETGLVILDALKEAAQRGVKVQVVADGFGSMSLGSKFPEEMARHNILFRFFSPLPFPGIFQAGRRLHHKVVVADGKRALVGGINISDRYRGTDQQLPWLDYALLAEGPVVLPITAICEKIFQKRFSRRGLRKLKKLKNTSAEPIPMQVRVSVNDWIRRRNEISSAYKHMLSGAHKEIIIVASYFVPTRRLLKILVRAARRGRKVSIILSRTSDVILMKPAMTYLYSKLLQAGINIFEYRESVLHAKLCVVDKRWVSIGSHNLNHLSEFISIEMNLEVLDHAFASQTTRELYSLMEERCIPITSADVTRGSNLFQKAGQWISYKLISWSMRILYFLNQKPVKDR